MGASWRDRQAALLLPFLPRLAVVFPCLVDALACVPAGGVECAAEVFEPLFAEALAWVLEPFEALFECEALPALVCGFFWAEFCAGELTTSVQASPATAAIRKMSSPAKNKGQIKDLPLSLLMRFTVRQPEACPVRMKASTSDCRGPPA